MEKQAIKEFLFGGTLELSRNKKYYYHSGMGVQYSHWTEEGKEALCDFMHIMAFKLKEAEEAELNQRAKDLVIKGLKGEQV